MHKTPILLLTRNCDNQTKICILVSILILFPLECIDSIEALAGNRTYSSDPLMMYLPSKDLRRCEVAAVPSILKESCWIPLAGTTHHPQS